MSQSTPITQNDASQVGKAPIGEEVLFTQQQVNDIAARESAKALERLFREVGCEFTGRAKEQQKEFVSAYRALRSDLEQAALQLADCRRELDEMRCQNQQQEADLARLNAVNCCLDNGIRPEAVADALKLLPAGADPSDYPRQVRALLQKYPFFAAKNDRRVAMPTLPQRRLHHSDDRMRSIAKKMGLV